MAKVDIQLYNDIVEGQSRLYMLRKWLAGLYGNTCGDSVDEDERLFAEAYNAAMKQLRHNLEDLDEDERAKLYARYLAVSNQAYDTGNLKEARNTLDSMTKLQGLSKSDNKNIKVKTDKENDVVEISFGFD